ncbi:carboxypeptidase-like regulatory domain-containing protein [Candidatus Saccharibacteria bacterium]|nr:carboxypeptidase-like regulatory domain-containing protein [Candidatus Saccharibacteria bacterium]
MPEEDNHQNSEPEPAEPGAVIQTPEADVEVLPGQEPAVTADHEHKEQKKPASDSRFGRFKGWYVHHKKFTIPGSVLVLALLLIAIPFTRFAIAGLFVTKNYSVTVVDSTTNTPVSGAKVSMGPISAETDGTGKATLKSVKPGSHQATFSKKYYKDETVSLTVSVVNQKQIPTIKMTATGHQVKVNVTDVVNKKTLGNVEIVAAGITSKTDEKGTATIVLPAGLSEQQAKLSLSGYNDTTVTIKVSNDKAQQNDFTMTPAGQVYFLSKLSGKIDVVKTNLDGTGRKTVLAGTGKEQETGTVLLASRDWKYLALLSRRAGNAPALYLIDTSNDSLSTIDEGNAEFSLAGWVNDDFVYSVTRTNVQLWQANRQALKGFNAPTKKLTTLDQVGGTGSGQSDYLNHYIGDVYAYDSQVLYGLNWSSAALGGTDNKQATFNTVKADGSAKKAIKSFGLAAGAQAYNVAIEQRVESPAEINLKFYDGNNDIFYVYANGQVKDKSGQTSDSFYNANYPTYLESPTDKQTFWSESRDGKNTLFVGNEEGQDGKQIATLSDYKPYGWYTDKYLLVSKNSSELYIMPNTGSTTPIKISDYHKPALTFSGYGGGYGGL